MLERPRSLDALEGRVDNDKRRARKASSDSSLWGLVPTISGAGDPTEPPTVVIDNSTSMCGLTMQLFRRRGGTWSEAVGVQVGDGEGKGDGGGEGKVDRDTKRTRMRIGMGMEMVMLERLGMAMGLVTPMEMGTVRFCSLFAVGLRKMPFFVW